MPPEADQTPSEAPATPAPAVDPAATPEPGAPTTPEPTAPVTPAEPAAPAAASTALTRPENLPDEFWDDASGLKVGDVMARLRDQAAEIETLKGSTADVPETADGYELKLPDDVKLPEGLSVEFKADDPAVKAMQEFALKSGMKPEVFRGLLGLEAQRQAAMHTETISAAAAELESLGDRRNERLAGVMNWLGANLPAKDAEAFIGSPNEEPPRFTAAQIAGFEKIIGLKSGPSMPGGVMPAPSSDRPLTMADTYKPYPPTPAR